MGDLEAQKQLMEETVAQAQQRAAGTTADLERRLVEFDAQRQTIDRALLEAPQVANTLLELQARVTQLTGPGQELGKAAQVVSELERRTAEAKENLAQRLSTLDAKQQAIDRASIDMKRIADVLSGLETRMAGLAQKHELLDRVGDDVAHIERRVDAVVARIELAARTRSQLEHEFGNPQTPLERVTEAAPTAIQWLVAHARQVLRPLSWRGALVGAFIAAVLFGVVAMRAAYRSGQNEAALLSSRVLRLPMLVPSTLRSPQLVARDLGASKVTTKDPLRDVRAAKDGAAGQQFVGDLAIESQPAGATVLLNQRPVGKTPVLLTSVRTGSYVLWIEREGYNRWTAAVLVSAVNQTRINAKLERTDRR
jgi:hypothetical protein